MAAFKDQVAVITGASSGVGEAIARSLAVAGAVVSLVARSAERLERIAESVRANGGEARCYPADLAEEEGLRELCRRLHRELRDIDVLVHSAGVISLGQLEHASVEELDRQYRINVRAPYALTQELLPLLRRRQGQIVFINSSVGVSAPGGVGQYAATKHGLKAIADSLRNEVNVEGIRVLSVFLGRTATPMQAAIHRAEGRAYEPERLLQPQDVAAVVIAALGLPRTAEVTDVSIRPMQKPGSDRS